ncbi:MAG: hypothetical protein AAFY60_17775, partial [Myxococcota bacterium]
MVTSLILLGALASSHAFSPTPCQLRARDYLPSAKALCGRVSVPLDPRSPQGTQLSLFVARVPAMQAVAEADPLVLIAGGPGQSTADFFASQRHAFAEVLLKRDLILVDQRGTGRSALMDCPLQEDLGKRMPLRGEKVRGALAGTS